MSDTINSTTDIARNDMSGNIEEFVEDFVQSDLVIGIVSLKGSGGSLTAELLGKRLNTTYGYDCSLLKVSDFIDREDVRLDYGNLQSTGNHLREEYGNDIFSRWAIDQIRKKRKKNGSQERPQVFIIDSLKNPDEARALKRVYGTNFWLISVFCPPKIREKRLKDVYSKKSKKSQKQTVPATVADVMDREVNERMPHGQKVTDTSALADYFIRNAETTQDTLKTSINRFLTILFPTSSVAPTQEELGMYHAASASKMSMCLSRPVGAAIVSGQGDLIATGYNEVPKFGGGHYAGADDESKDHRCYMYGECFNDREKLGLASDIAEEIISQGIGQSDIMEKLTNIIRFGSMSRILEFSRSIHAEMSALMSAIRSGQRHVVGSTLFVTTFPCHNCARHIVASGIHKVVFVEPYSKSMALLLHEDALTEDPNEQNKKVLLQQYEGVGTERFYEIFRDIRPQKAKGSLITRDSDELRAPTRAGLSLSVEDLESRISDEFPVKGDQLL